MGLREQALILHKAADVICGISADNIGGFICGNSADNIGGFIQKLCVIAQGYLYSALES